MGFCSERNPPASMQLLMGLSPTSSITRSIRRLSALSRLTQRWFDIPTRCTREWRSDQAAVAEFLERLPEPTASEQYAHFSASPDPDYQAASSILRIVCLSKEAP